MNSLATLASCLHDRTIITEEQRDLLIDISSTVDSLDEGLYVSQLVCCLQSNGASLPDILTDILAAIQYITNTGEETPQANLQSVEQAIITLGSGANLQTIVDSLSQRLRVEPLSTIVDGYTGGAIKVPIDVSSSTSGPFPTGTARISIYANGASGRFEIATGGPEANASDSHFIAKGERIDIKVGANYEIAAISDATLAEVGVLEVSCYTNN